MNHRQALTSEKRFLSSRRGSNPHPSEDVTEDMYKFPHFQYIYIFFFFFLLFLKVFLDNDKIKY